MKVQDEEWLQRKFETENLPKTEIARQAECNRGTVAKYVKEFGLERRWKDSALLEELYWDEGMSTREIADELNCGASSIKRQMKKHGIALRKSCREKPPYFGLHPDGRGYEVIRHNDHFFYHHRLCAIAWFGFAAVRENHIHHVNSIEWDNREDNIEPLKPDEHIKMHWKNRELHGEHNNAEKLESLYHQEGMTQEQMAEELDVHKNTIINKMNEFDIETGYNQA